jgi:glucokinase
MQGAAMLDIVTADIGGTHARFAIARIQQGKVWSLGDLVTLRTANYPDLPSAWRAFAERFATPLPQRAAIAVAAPVVGDEIELTNSHWQIRPAAIDGELELHQSLLINDFVAVGHAVAALPPADLRHLCGPTRDLAMEDAISVIGPGTGLGIAQVRPRHGGGVEVVPSEGGHIGFAPLDAVEDAILARLRARHGRVSAERIVSGPGLPIIHEVLAQDAPATTVSEAELWAWALAGTDPLAAAALDRFCACLGSVAGDLALAQGATAVVIAGGLGLRLKERLPASSFADRFTAKGRLEAMMRGMPVKLVTHEQPGLYGAAAAFATSHFR